MAKYNRGVIFVLFCENDSELFIWGDFMFFLILILLAQGDLHVHVCLKNKQTRQRSICNSSTSVIFHIHNVTLKACPHWALNAHSIRINAHWLCLHCKCEKTSQIEFTSS